MIGVPYNDPNTPPFELAVGRVVRQGMRRGRVGHTL